MVSRSRPSCQIQWVSRALYSPGAAAPQWVTMASEMSKWLLEWQPQVSPIALHSWATRTEPCMVQKCGSASGMETDCRARAWVS